MHSKEKNTLKLIMVNYIWQKDSNITCHVGVILLRIMISQVSIINLKLIDEYN